MIYRKSLLILWLTSLTACSGFYFPGVHKINIQQGNLVTQPMIDKLKPGMSKNQVLYVMGRPVIQDPLNQDRWDYVHTFQYQDLYESRNILTLYFVNDRLEYFEGDYLPTEEITRIKESQQPDKQSNNQETSEQQTDKKDSESS
ncbi:MAG: outer membrane protein assembly factor BamE [Gammaproteobacteria bacterium]|nr:outer membrane protein assembly factor BamE [Gammaproteobacteria bacterium]